MRSVNKVIQSDLGILLTSKAVLLTLRKDFLFLDTCATCPELPSDIKARVNTRTAERINLVKAKNHDTLIDGDSELGAHVRNILCYLTCLRHLKRSREGTSRTFFLRKDPFFFIRAQHLLSNHLNISTMGCTKYCTVFIGKIGHDKMEYLYHIVSLAAC